MPSASLKTFKAVSKGWHRRFNHVSGTIRCRHPGAFSSAPCASAKAMSLDCVLNIKMILIILLVITMVFLHVLHPEVTSVQVR
jgi:hypothetical protein